MLKCTRMTKLRTKVELKFCRCAHLWSLFSRRRDLGQRSRDLDRGSRDYDDRQTTPRWMLCVSPSYGNSALHDCSRHPMP